MYFGYARVSISDQTPNLQTEAQTAASCEKIYTNKISGAKSDRPELKRLKDQLRKGYMLIVWRLDRLGRSLKA